MADGFLSRVLRRISGLGTTPGTRGSGRVSGPPTSSNRASSFHLAWEVPPQPFVEVRADLEITQPPSVDRLYFWALQVNFADRAGGGVNRGGAHTGLQHHPSYPGGGAVNWGGYHSGGGELEGTTSVLPSALDNVNTRNYPWRPANGYRFRVFAVEPGDSNRATRWRATVTDLSTGIETAIRDLLVEADSLINPMVWSEVFADCDHDPCTVAWSNLEADLATGGTVRAKSVRLNYQSHADGGCINTNTHVDASGEAFLQTTNTQRINRTGATLTLS